MNWSLPKKSVPLAILTAALNLSLFCSLSQAQELRVEPLDDAPPADVLSPEIIKQLSPKGFKVMSGTSRTVCEIWPCSQWPTKADFKPSNSVLYPFEMGQLMGVIRYKRKAGDFRGQEIPSGVYTLRYALQPEDGNHVGTSDTRDFLLLLPPADDKLPGIVSKENLFKLSPKASGTTHPAMLSLLAPTASVTTARMRHDEARELWSLGFSGKITSGKTSELPIEIVVVGRAAE
jgi:hypothetical protein